MKYDKVNDKYEPFPLMVMESSEYSPNQSYLRDDEYGVWLYHANCINYSNNAIIRGNGRHEAA